MSPERSPGRELVGGAARVFAAEVLIFPTALITSAFLTRRLGPSGYGLYTIAIATVVWLEWTLSAFFARAAVKLVADAPDWRPVGAVVLRLFALSGLAGGFALFVAAGPIAALFHEPTLARLLRVLAVDVPLFTISQAHQQILVGTGDYARRAFVSAARWTARMVFVIVLVAAGLSVEGAIIGIVLATALEVIVARWFVRPGLRGGGEHVTLLWSYALPLFLAAVSMRAFDKLDLFTLKALGASAALAGQYGAAQNLTIGPGLVALSVSGLLLSTLTRTLRTGSTADAARLGRNALRGALLLLPFAGIIAGSATPLALFVFGDAFAPTGPLLSILIFGALGLLVISISSALLIAIGRSTWVAAVALPLPLIALAAQLVVIPRFGANGAAAVTTAVAALGVLSAIVAVERAWGMLPPPASVARAVLLTVGAYAASAWWGTSGFALLLEMLTLCLLVPLAYWATGELAPDERAALASLIRRGGAAGAESG